MSHGTAGICLALLRLYERTRGAELLAAVEEGWGYERALFDASTGQWARPTAADADFASSWCNGAPGIALARLATLQLCDDDAVRQEISQALVSARSLDLGVMDQICCGNVGRAEVLIYAAVKLGQPELGERAGELAGRVLVRAKERGHFTLVRAGESLPDLRFFTGETGIAYSLLRLEHAAEIPCVLAFE
jgi:lantibiotic modifying enzyme